MIFASIILLLLFLAYLLVLWIRLPETTSQKCADCQQYRRHNEPQHEITGCPVGGYFQYIEKDANREHRTIGFVRAATQDEQDKQTVENILAEMDKIAERDRQENFKRQCLGRIIRKPVEKSLLEYIKDYCAEIEAPTPVEIMHQTIGDPDADARDLAREGKVKLGPQVERSYYTYGHANARGNAYFVSKGNDPDFD